MKEVYHVKLLHPYLRILPKRLLLLATWKSSECDDNRNLRIRPQRESLMLQPAASTSSHAAWAMLRILDACTLTHDSKPNGAHVLPRPRARLKWKVVNVNGRTTADGAAANWRTLRAPAVYKSDVATALRTGEMRVDWSTSRRRSVVAARQLHVKADCDVWFIHNVTINT